jgi:hypothetical protein
MKNVIPEHTRRNRIMGFRALEVAAFIAVSTSVIFWVLRDKPPSEQQVEIWKIQQALQLLNFNYDAQAKTTRQLRVETDALTEITDEIDTMIERLATEIQK